MPLVARAVLNKCIDISRSVPGGGGGGGALRYRGGPHPHYVFRGRRVRSIGGGGGGGGSGREIPLTIHGIYAALMPSDCRRLPSLLPALAAAKRAEDYKI